MSPPPLLRLPRGLEVAARQRRLAVPELELASGDWVALAPERPLAGDEAARALAAPLATLAAPAAGKVELFGRALAPLGYLDLQRLRARLGFVAAWGGLLANRSLAENVALPVAAHGPSGGERGEEAVARLLAELDLVAVAGLRPHRVEGAARFRASVARALVRRPEWLVVEAPAAVGGGLRAGWERLLACRGSGGPAAAICLDDPGGEVAAWLGERGVRRIVCVEVAARAAGGSER